MAGLKKFTEKFEARNFDVVIVKPENPHAVSIIVPIIPAWRFLLSFLFVFFFEIVVIKT